MTQSDTVRTEGVPEQRTVNKPSLMRTYIERYGSFILVVFLVGFWEFSVRYFDVPRFLLPTPSEIAVLMVDEAPLLRMHGTATIISIVLGYLCAVTFALSVSALMIAFP